MKIFNTMSNRLEEFDSKTEVKMYVCGLTVYDHVHIGHARTYLAFDIVRRYLQFKGYKVFYVQNITDVDDKIINRARELGIDPLKLAEKFAEEGLRDLESVGIARADIYPRVTENIPDIIKAIQLLIEKGFAYEVEGNVYFDVLKFKDYGKLSKLSLEQIKAGVRGEIDERKRHFADFALWKRVENNFGFNSPWGRGRPGWHIECSVMASKFLGSEIDIHGGAVDLIFPHHENEIAQSEALLERQFVRFWIHTGFLQVAGKKMSKSLGNFILLRDLLKRYDAEVIRLFFASAHYRSPIDFDYAKLEQAKASLEKIYGTLKRIISQAREREISEGERELQLKIKATREEFLENMDNDFDTVKALASLFKLTGEINKFLAKHGEVNKKLADEIISTYRELGGILNLFNKYIEKMMHGESAGMIKDLIELLLEIRQEARDRKDWKTADRIRDKLRDM
ncbi:cysteine--tRNA ligase, partial [Candidatus Bathyarchaeota archaeon]|nr:cysteine--tRNA ligase [Candidatus Bathyarchaeota archaeon]